MRLSPASVHHRWVLDFRRAAGWTAVACAFANAVAAAAMVVAIRPGSPVVTDVGARFQYLADHRVRWVVGWCTWVPAAVSLLLFYIVLSLALDPACRRLARMAVVVGAVGVVPDISAEILAMVSPPRLAEAWLDASSPGREWIESVLWGVDRQVAILTGFVGNGLYTVAGSILNGIAFRTNGFPRWLAVAGVPVWAAGYVLSGAALAGSTAGMMAATAVLMPSFVLWAYGVGTCYFWRTSPSPPASSAADPARRVP